MRQLNLEGHRESSVVVPVASVGNPWSTSNGQTVGSLNLVAQKTGWLGWLTRWLASGSQPPVSVPSRSCKRTAAGLVQTATVDQVSPLFILCTSINLLFPIQPFSSPRVAAALWLTRQSPSKIPAAPSPPSSPLEAGGVCVCEHRACPPSLLLAAASTDSVGPGWGQTIDSRSSTGDRSGRWECPPGPT